MIKDYEKYLRTKEVQKHNFDEKSRVEQTMRKYHILTVLTLGIYSLVTTKPVARIRECPNEEIPFSGIYAFGPSHVTNGIHELINRGMLKRVTEREGENIIDVFFPTPILISCIMERQEQLQLSQGGMNEDE